MRLFSFCSFSSEPGPGTEKFTDSLIDRMTDDPSFFLSAIKCLRMPQAHRDKIGGIINAQRCKVGNTSTPVHAPESEPESTSAIPAFTCANAGPA